MKLFVGLGNPGRRYQDTRHNVGWMMLEALSRKLEVKATGARFSALVGEARLPESFAGRFGQGGEPLVLLKPQTYMNASGYAVAQAARCYGIAPEALLVLLDERQLPLGSIRLRRGGSDGGHKGLGDVIAHLATEQFPRLRLGIGARDHPDSAEGPPSDLTDFVLSRFSAEEQAVITPKINQAAEAALVWAGSGIEEAMNRFNE